MILFKWLLKLSILLVLPALSYGDQLTFTWDYNVSQVPTEFRVYIQHNCIGDFILSSSVLYPQQTLVQRNISYNTLYCFVGTAYDATTGQESDYSNIIRFHCRRRKWPCA